MKKSSAKSKPFKEAPSTSKETVNEPNNPPVEERSADSPVFDERAQPPPLEAKGIAEPPEGAKATHVSEPKAAIEISKHDRRTASAALKIAKLEKVPARGTLKAKDIAALPEVSEDTVLDFVTHCRSIGADLSKLSWEKAAQIAKDRA